MRDLEGLVAKASCSEGQALSEFLRSSENCQIQFGAGLGTRGKQDFGFGASHGR